MFEGQADFIFIIAFELSQSDRIYAVLASHRSFHHKGSYRRPPYIDRQIGAGIGISIEGAHLRESSAFVDCLNFRGIRIDRKSFCGGIGSFRG